MPKNDGYAQNVSFPVFSDAANIETAFQTVVNGIVPLGVMRFANANARSAALINGFAPRPGMITYLIAEDRYDGRMKDGTWQPLSPGVWQPLTLGGGMSVHAGSPGACLSNGIVNLRGRIARSNGGQFSTGTTWTVAILPFALRPVTNMYMITPVEIGSGVYYSRTEILTNGEINVITPPGGTGTAGMHWTGLDGLSFSI